MIILSFLVFMVMLVWGIASVLFVVLGFTSDNGKGFLAGCAAVLSMVCWYQVLVWGEPWFRMLGQAWM